MTGLYHTPSPSGYVFTRVYPRPQLVSDYYFASTIIDDDNKLRQALLALEKKWPTQDCWRRLVTTLIGMSVVNFYRLMQKVQPDVYDTMPVLEFADRICGVLSTGLDGVGTRKVRPRAGFKRGSSRCSSPPAADPITADSPMKLAKRPGNKSKRASLSDRSRGRQGGERQGNCWECRRWCARYRQTTFVCPHCELPICSTVDRPRRVRDDDNPKQGKKSCYQLHREDKNPLTKCRGHKDEPGTKRQFPPSLKCHPE